MDGFLARRRGDPRYTSERRVEPFAHKSLRRDRHVFSMKAEASSKEHDSSSSDDEGEAKKKKKKKKKGIYKSGEDADGDGKTNEAADDRVTDFSDKDGNGKPDAFEKKKKKKKDEDKE